MKNESGIIRQSTLTPEQRELKDRINDRMRDVSPEEYDKFILDRGRDKKAINLSKELSEILDKDKKYDTLELGAGTGIFTKELNNIPNVNLTSLDIRKDLVDYGIKLGRIKNDKVVIGDFEKMPIKENSFDILTGMAFINQRRDAESFFSEARRILKDEGLVFFPWIKRKGESFEREKKFLEEHGFEIVNVEGNYILARKMGIDERS